MPPEDKREKVRLASDKLFRWPTREEIAEREAELYEARERAKLSVLDLTPRDRRFLKAMKIAF